jgi:drug/metabolite transporter (DMT)-like permease
MDLHEMRDKDGTHADHTPEPPVSRRGALLFAALCLVWGIPYLLIKIAVEEVPPVGLVFLRTGLAAALLLPIALARGQVLPVLRRWRPLLAYTVIEIAIPWLLLSEAERHLTSSLTGLLIAAVPLVGAGIALATGARERIGAAGLAGLLLGMAGVAALVGFDVGGSSLGAVAAVAVVVVGYAVGPAILARYLSDLPGLGVVACSLTLCAVGYAPFAPWHLPPSMPSQAAVVSIVLLAVVCTAAAFLLLFALVAEVGPVRATVITYVNPAVAVAAGALILSEPVTTATMVGFALIIVGSVLATRRSRPSAEPAEAPVRCEAVAAEPH